MNKIIWLILLAVSLASCSSLMAQNQDSESKPSINKTVLKQLIERAKVSDSDAIVIWKDGKLVYENYFGKERGPIESMSATKSVVALAFGLLLADGKLESLDEPVHKYYPEWNQGLKAQITIHHLLTQRSGLQCDRRTTAIYRAPDFVQFALAADLIEEPGTTFRYNNKGCNLLPGIVKKISGRRMDKFIGERIFEPLGITDWSWTLDKAGNPHGMSGLQIRPEDFVKIGQLMLDGGKWKGKQILPADFVAECIRDQITGKKPDDTSKLDFEKLSAKEIGPALGYGVNNERPYGLLWWLNLEPQTAVTDRLLKRWKRGGVDDAFITRMEKLKGVPSHRLGQAMREHKISESDFFENVVNKGQLDWDVVGWKFEGFRAAGFLGQYLVVAPKQRIVAVRMRRAPKGNFDESKIDAFGDFADRIFGLGINQ